MTLLVARQCRLLRAPHGPLPCLQRLTSTTATARSPASETKDEANTAKTATATATPTPKPRYANKKLALLQYKQKQRIQSLRNRYPLTPKYEHSDIVPVHSAILIPASVTATPQHFVDKIEPVATALLAKRNLVVFLVTPSFAPWLLDDRVFLEKALDQLYKNIAAPTPVVHAICAVVNKLPPATPLRGHDVGPRVGKRAASPPVNETGFEGIAYVTLPAKAELSALPQLSGELGCIDFLAHTHTQAQGKRNDRIRVPLANTIFQTGETSTLIKSTWERRSDGVGFQMRSRTVRQAAAINLSAEDPMPIDPPHSHIYQEASALSIPLVPLTSPRQVDGHMGNIIRGVIKPDGSKMTASTELEHVVPRYFKARGEPAQATSAWALVIPKAKAQIAMTKTRTWLHPNLAASAGSEVPDAANDRSASAEEEETQESWEAFWQKDPPRWNLSIQQLIATGARLHKVLSGGGGWGKKAGLLSLDPVPLGAPEPRKQTSKEDEADGFDSVSDFSTALKPVVRDGDYIQFFISPKVTEAHDVSTFQHLKKLEQSTSKHAWSWEFGVVPSTVDSIPGGSWQHTTAASEEMVVFRGSFGALTEGSLTLMRGIRANTKTGIAQSLGTTSIDVPFSRWSGIRLFPKESQANDADSSTATKHQDSNTKPKVNIDFIHDAPFLTISSQSARANASLPLRTSRRPQKNQVPTANAPTTRAKSTSAKLRDLDLTKELKQSNVHSDSAAQHILEKAKQGPRSKLTSPQSAEPREPARSLLRRIVPKEPDRFVVRRLIVNKEATEPTPNRSRSKGSAPVRGDSKSKGEKEHNKHSKHRKDNLGRFHQHERVDEEVTHKEQLAKGKQRPKPRKEKTSGHLTIRRVLAAPLPDADTKTERAKPSAEEVIERARVSGKTLARLTEQLKLITGLKGSDLDAMGRWRQRTKTQHTSTPALSNDRRRSLIRQVKPKEKDEQTSQPRHTPAPSSTPNLTPRQLRIAAHRSPHGLDFTMRSIPLTHTTANIPHTLKAIHARLRTIIQRTAHLTLRLSSHLPNTPIPITKHASKPLRPQRPPPRSLNRPSRRRGSRAPVRKIPTQPALKIRRPAMGRGGRLRVRKFETMGLRMQRLRVRKFETVGLRVRRLRGERKRGLQDEVKGWLGGAGGIL